MGIATQAWLKAWALIAPSSGKALHTKRGMSLVETSALVAIMAVTAITAASLNNSSTSDASKISNTTARMTAISEALDRYRARQGRLPCPADPYLLPNSKRAAGAPTASYSTTYGTEYRNPQTADCLVTEGMVPINALGLNDNFAIDGWGRRFTYHISSGLCGNTPNVADRGCATLDYRGGKGAITVKDRNNGSAVLTTEAAYVLLSHGENGAGAFMPTGIKQGKTSSPDEQENINGNDVFVTGNLTATTKNNSTTSFDDLVRYKLKNQIESTVLNNTRPLVSTESCEDASASLASLTLSSIGDLRTLVGNVRVSEGLAGGDVALIDLFWTLQQVCVRYYGSKGKDDWKGARCPGGGTYREEDQTCSCADGSWDGNCTKTN